MNSVSRRPADVISMIAELRDAEVCRNIESMRAAFSPLWNDIEAEPDFDGYEPPVKAQLLRYAGFLLSFYGRSRCLKDYQARGKDLLTEAVRIFEDLGNDDRAAEAKVMLALCYWYAGEVAECEAILETVENEFSSNPLHPVYLQIRVNRLMTLYWKGDFETAAEVIEALRVPMEFCTDLRLAAMYYSQSGLVAQAKGDAERAVFFLNEAVRTAQQANNQRFASWTLNNLANAYKDLGQFEAANQAITKAVGMMTELGDTGWLPHALDTHALILMAEGRVREALGVIEDAIREFEKTEDASGHCDALWTRVQCLVGLGRYADAAAGFAGLYAKAGADIGAIATRKYSEAFAAIAFPPSPPATSGHASLPSLFDEIRRLELPRDAHCSIKGFPTITEFEVFLVPSGFGSPIGAIEDSAVALISAERCPVGSVILTRERTGFRLTVVEFEPVVNLRFAKDANGFPVPIEDVEIVGRVAAVCPISSIRGKNIVLVPLKPFAPGEH